MTELVKGKATLPFHFCLPSRLEFNKFFSLRFDTVLEVLLHGDENRKSQKLSPYEKLSRKVAVTFNIDIKY